MARECVTGAAYNQEMELDDILPTHDACTQAAMYRRVRHRLEQDGSACLNRLVLGLAILLASGCSLTTPPPLTTTRPVVAPHAATTSTRPPLSPAAALAVARDAEGRAASLSGEARAAALEEAAAAWVVAGDGGAAARVFAQLPPAKTPSEQRTLLAAEIALAQGQPLRAAQALDRLPTSGPSPALRWARARVAFARGQAVLGVQLIADAVPQPSPRESSAINERLWSKLRSAAKRGADLTTPAGGSAPVAGWLDLARTTLRADQSPAARATLFQEWRRRHPAHPANGPLVVSMIEASPPLPPSTGRIALLLPLSGRAQAAGTSVRDGFLAAWYARPAGGRPKIEVYDTGTDALAAYRRAVSEGAQAVVGPLTKEEVGAVARSAAPGIPLLALNFLPEGTPASPLVFQYSLAPEDEAIEVARRLIAEGRRHGIALVPTGEWGQRVQRAFEETLRAGGGRLIAMRTYAPDTADFTAPILELLGVDEAKRRYQKLAQALGTPLEFAATRRNNIEFVFIAGQPQAARLIRPQLRFHYAGDLPVYATSEVYDPSPKANLDLEGVMFPDMPWMIDPDPTAVDVRNDLRTAWPERFRRRGRLYALGFDAYAAVSEIMTSRNPFRAPLSGMTGRLTVDAERRLHRELEWLQVRGGELRPLPPAGLAATEAP
jgi:outer membrane PBP1 activator LpoA protein